MEKKALSELNLIDDFLFEEAFKRGKKGERFAQILLQTIPGKKFRTVKVVAQNNVRGVSPTQHGIRLDACVETAEPFAPEYDAEKVWEAAKNHMAYL